MYLNNGNANLTFPVTVVGISAFDVETSLFSVSEFTVYELFFFHSSTFSVVDSIVDKFVLKKDGTIHVLGFFNVIRYMVDAGVRMVK